VMVGELDMICGPAHARALAAALPDARVVVVPDCGPLIGAEAPEAFRQAILEFVG